jgi:hypothetical protein
MDKFKEVHMMFQPDGTPITMEEYSKLAYNGAKVKVFLNDKYTVAVREYDKDEGEAHAPQLVWLSIKRNDKEPVHDWRDLQEIKNELVGVECEGIELYPAESRRVDTANQYHLWCIKDTTFRFGVGFNERVVSDSQTASEIGAKQRAIDEDKVTHTTDELRTKMKASKK